MDQGYFLFLRVLTGSGKAWFENASEDLASSKLDADLGACSVYMVLNDLEEVQVASAHFATMNRKKIEKIAGLKVHAADILNSGLEYSNTPGTTGFTFIDQKHYDITGEKLNFANLAEKISNKLKAGENLFRYFEEPQISAILKDFLHSKQNEMETRYKDKIIKCLGSVITSSH